MVVNVLHVLATVATFVVCALVASQMEFAPWSRLQEPGLHLRRSGRAPGPTITPHPASSGLPPSDAADEAKHIYHALAPRPPSAPPTRAQSNVMQETAAVAPPPPAPRQLEPPALSQPPSLPAQPLPTKPPPEPAQSSKRSSAPPSGEPPPPRAKRVAVAFYGLTRSLRFTAASIHANILGPLRDAGYAVETFLHTYDLQHLRNERSHEDADLNSTEWRLLQPDHHAVTHQDDFLRDYELPIQACETFHLGSRRSATVIDAYHDHFASIRNLLCQLHSIAAVTGLWRATGRAYDAVVYVRPDMLYNCPLPVAQIARLDDNSVYVADFHHFKGLNDRFVMGTERVAGAWGERLNFALATCMTKRLHAETLVHDLVQHYRFDTRMLDFYFYRVRSSGKVSPRDRGLPKCDAGAFRAFGKHVAAINKRRGAGGPPRRRRRPKQDPQAQQQR